MHGEHGNVLYHLSTAVLHRVLPVLIVCWERSSNGSCNPTGAGLFRVGHSLRQLGLLIKSPDPACRVARRCDTRPNRHIAGFWDSCDLASSVPRADSEKNNVTSVNECRATACPVVAKAAKATLSPHKSGRLHETDRVKPPQRHRFILPLCGRLQSLISYLAACSLELTSSPSAAALLRPFFITLTPF